MQKDIICLRFEPVSGALVTADNNNNNNNTAFVRLTQKSRSVYS